jgi:CheY-like chemotaxis protein
VWTTNRAWFALARQLGRDGYSADTAGNRWQALAQFQARRYDVMLSDLRLPELDGRAFYAIMGQHYAYLRQRVMFLTGNGGEADGRTLLEPCGVRWLYTPCTTAEVLSALQQVVTFSTVNFSTAFPAQKCKDLRSSYGRLGEGKDTKAVLIIGQP